ncbi:phosphatase PAP2 family protein [Embleya sp. NPDC059237]|uniref:phosphatase PAP2 family protein n=1 Tax=Embleya sp. NPDC059237 TaxID=3346784 RepID=UPI00369600CB
MGGNPSRETMPPSGRRLTDEAGRTTMQPIPTMTRLRVYLHTPRRPRFVVELALVALSYWVYSLIRNAVPEREHLAVDRAWQLLDVEKALHIDIEHSVNHAVNGITWLIVPMNYYYATLHFVVTIGVLVWLFHKHPGRYRAVRTVLFLTTGLALFGYFFYALAPPRLLPGADYIDTVLVHHTWGSMASGDMKNVSNQYAAMPSMHIGWSTWCALAIVMFARPLWAKVLGVLYPIATLFVIVATGNHFVLDAVGGWITLAAAFGVQCLVNGRSAYRFPQYPPDDPRAAPPPPTDKKADDDHTPDAPRAKPQREPVEVSSSP